MMISLLLFAVVGAALSFKIIGPYKFCTIPALYYDDPIGNPDFYYCEWDFSGLPVQLGGTRDFTIACSQFINGCCYRYIKHLYNDPPN